jgi:hypothetical protein
VLYEAIEAARKANAKWMETYVPKNLKKMIPPKEDDDKMIQEGVKGLFKNLGNQ